MAETMVDRVAKAIYEGRNGSGCKPWARLTKAHQTPYVLDAMNALHEMRAPTTAMLSSARGYEDNMSESSIEALWEMLIDAALSEGGE